MIFAFLEQGVEPAERRELAVVVTEGDGVALSSHGGGEVAE